ncbi:hypothetical protein GQ55_4G188400 [Panicum hallii var. hallii]|uniref:Reverse transcriptase domain-containing protein n=1 Tax=Panicum hallii var. hallii TaxID=1504633 RepID=A0A2T7DYW6_9POAL|nr:hypothetical protein GQ55_4G188400 [Panicum hallii var. hallii]
MNPHLKLVLDKMREHNLYLKRSKCSFAQDRLEYLGHIISAQGVSADPTKTQPMVNWPRPTTVTELRGFLGLTGYYRNFVKAYGIMAKPLTKFLKKNSLGGQIWLNRLLKQLWLRLQCWPCPTSKNLS